MATDPTRVLITGFGPFPGVHFNPTSSLIEWIAEGCLRIPSGVDLKTAIVPTSWAAVREHAENIFPEFEADIVLHFGVSKRAKGIQIEQYARNSVSTGADCEGKRFSGHCIVEGAPRALRTSIDVETLVHKLLQNGLKANHSRDAGRYLCNMLYFLTLDRMRVSGSSELILFIHIPPIRPQNFNKNNLLKAVQIILAHCVSLHRRVHHERNTGNS